MVIPNFNRALSAFGIGTIVLWLSYAAYLPPFAQWPNVKGLAEEGWKAREFVQEKYHSQQDMENRINRTLYVGYAKGYMMIIAGIIAGVLSLARQRAGRYLALTLAAIMLGSRIVGAVTHPGGIAGWFTIIYGYFLVHTPVKVIHNDIIAPLFFIFTILFYLFHCVQV